MRLLLLCNTLFEAALAFVLVFMPEVLFPEASGQTQQVLRVLAGNAAGFAALSFSLMGRTDPRVLRPGLLAMAVFHGSVLMAQLANSLSQGALNPALIPHSVFAVCFSVAALQSFTRSWAPR